MTRSSVFMCAVAVCTAFTHLNCVQFKMYKTDPATWNQRWSYGFSGAQDAIPGVMVKTIKKETTITFDPNKDKFLHVCPSVGRTQDGKGCASLDLQKYVEEMEKGNAILIQKKQNTEAFDLLFGPPPIDYEKNKPITVKIYKTDPDARNTEWYYGFSATPEEKPTAYKPITKMVVTSFKPLGEGFLHIKNHATTSSCTAAPFDLNGWYDGTMTTAEAIKNKGLALVIDRACDVKLKSIPEINKILGDTSVILHKINVVKFYGNDNWWTIKAIHRRSPDFGDKEVVYGTTRIKQNTEGKLTPKLRVPKNAPFVITVTGTGVTNKQDQPVTQAQAKNLNELYLNIDGSINASESFK